MTEVKICGLMCRADVSASSRADYQGFVVTTGTRRSLTVEVARDLVSRARRPAVAVTTSGDADTVVSIAQRVRPHAVQLNGTVDEAMLRAVREAVECEVWVAAHIGPGTVMPERAVLSQADCVVLDTATPQGGGAGIVHDHEISARLCRELPTRCALAGGLTAENVLHAISLVRPNIVDVSSGVETNGVKDALKIDHFIEKVRTCQ